jgi:hypothetical protein
LDVVGSGVELKADDQTADANGQLILGHITNIWSQQSGVFGHILATGSRVVTSGQTADQFAGQPTLSAGVGNPGTTSTGYYAIIQFDCNSLAGNRPPAA